MAPRRLSVVAILLLCLLLPSASAHPGRTDSNGGHYDRSTGDYHYHHGMSAHYHNADGSCPYDENWNIQHGYSTGTVRPTASPKAVLRSSAGSGSGTPKNWSTPTPATNSIPASRSSSSSALPWIGGIAGGAGLIGLIFSAARKRRVERQPVPDPVPSYVPARVSYVPPKPVSSDVCITPRNDDPILTVPRDPVKSISFSFSSAELYRIQAAINFLMRKAQHDADPTSQILVWRYNLLKISFLQRRATMYKVKDMKMLSSALVAYADFLRSSASSSYVFRIAENVDALCARIDQALKLDTLCVISGKRKSRLLSSDSIPRV